jgi:hypothetical protein
MRNSDPYKIYKSRVYKNRGTLVGTSRKFREALHMARKISAESGLWVTICFRGICSKIR